MSMQLGRCQWFIWFLFIFNVIPDSTQEKLKVSIYYEALCPDSIDFFKRQLQQAYPVIGQHITLDLVPYGKATHLKRNGQWVFSCHHGNNECYANQIQACAMNQDISQNNKVHFLLCLINSRRRPALTQNMVIQQCGNENSLSVESLYNCMRGELKNELLAKYGDQTAAVNPNINFVPTVIFNDHYDAYLQNDALEDFLGTVCGQLHDPPNNCPQTYFR